MEAGARLALAPVAQLEEPVAPSRAQLSWLLRRRFRMGQTHGSLSARGTRRALVNVPVTLMKVAYCGALALAAIPFPGMRNANLLRGALHVGTLSVLFGAREVTIYGKASGET